METKTQCLEWLFVSLPNTFRETDMDTDTDTDIDDIDIF